MNRLAVSTNMASTALKPVKNDDKGFIHSSAIIDPSVHLGDNVAVHANVVIERECRIGDNTVINAGCYIGEECVLGEGTVLMPSVTLREKTQVGSRVLLGAGVVVGSDGFGYAKQENGENFKIPQVGHVIIEDNVQIGANTTIDRATLGQTVIGTGVRIGSLVQVGHNVRVGEGSDVGDGAGICGSCKIGNKVQIGRGVGMVGHIKIGDSAQVANGSGISKDVLDGVKMQGVPAMDEEAYSKFTMHLHKLPDLASRLQALEKRVNSNSKENTEE